MKHSLQYRRLLTALNAFCIFTIGIVQTIPAPNLSDLKNLVNATTSDISYGFSVISFAGCVGAFFFGWSYNVWNRQKQYICGIFVAGLITVTLPHLRSLTQYLFAQAVFGFMLGGIVSVQNVLVLEMWEKDSNPYMQATHFCWALGSTAAPLISAPFLSRKVDVQHSTEVAAYNSSGNIYLQESTTVNNLIESNLKDAYAENNMKLWIPFTIAGFTGIFAASTLLLTECVRPYRPPPRSVGRKANEGKHGKKASVSNLTHVTFIGLCAIILGIFLNVEVMLIYFLPTFLQNSPIGISDRRSSYLTAVMFACHTTMRGLSVFISTKVKPHVMLYACFFVVGAANVLIFMYYDVSEKMLIIPLALLGFGLSPVYPALHSFVELYVDETNIVSAVMMVISTVPSIVSPIILGKTLVSLPLLFIYINIVCMTACLMLFGATHAMARYSYSGKPREKRNRKVEKVDEAAMELNGGMAALKS